MSSRRPKEIFEAIQSHDLEKVEHLLQDDDYVESLKGTPVPPPLVIAAILNSEHITQILIQKGKYGVNDKNWSSATPLIEVAHRNGNLEIATQLIDAGADVNARDDEGDTAIIWACRNGYFDLMKLLIQHSAEVDVQNSYGSTAVHEAICTYVSKGRSDFKIQLLEYFCSGPNPAKTDEVGIHHLQEVLEKQEVVLSLRDTQGRALYASGKKNIKMLSTILQAGANMNARDAHGTTPLLKATYTGSIKVVSFLLEKQASLIEGHIPLAGSSSGPGWKSSTWNPSPDVLKLYLRTACYQQYFQHLTDLFLREVLMDNRDQVYVIQPHNFILSMHIAGCPFHFLLQALGLLELQSSRQEELQSQITELQASGPQPLLLQCRQAVRTHLQSGVSTKLPLLNIPRSLCVFLDLPELDAILPDRPCLLSMLETIIPATSDCGQKLFVSDDHFI